MSSIVKQSAPILIVAMVVVGALEGYALYLGHNGLLLTSAIGVICVLAGVKAGKVLECRGQAKVDKEIDSIPPSEPSEGEPRR